MFKKETYINRRKELKEILKTGLVIIPGNNESPRNYPDNCYNFDQDSTFLYYFGIDLPHLIGVIDIDNDKEYIFGNDYTLDDIVWSGDQKLIQSWCDDVGVKNFNKFDDIYTFIKEKGNTQKILFTKQYRADNMILISVLINKSPLEVNDCYSIDLTKAIVSQRNIKSQEEIEEIEKAVNITREMHFAAFRNVLKYNKEYEIVAAIEAQTKKYNGSTSFTTIFSRNSQILHNHYYNNKLQDKNLFVLDCGARNINGYCGDMTTTIPVNNNKIKFTEQQIPIYQLLIKMFDTAANTLKEGINYKDVHLKVCKVLSQGMVDLGLMKGDPSEIVEQGAHALFFPHGLGHMLGLDVHDMENLGEDLVGYDDDVKRDMRFGFKSLRLARKLKQGFVFTVEPGIYFIPELIKRWKNDKKYEQYLNYNEIEKYTDFGGMRYEGDFTVTKDGARRIGKKMPKTIEEVENINIDPKL